MCVYFGGVQHKRLNGRGVPSFSYALHELREHGHLDYTRYDWGRLFFGGKQPHKDIWNATVRAVCRIAKKRHEKKTSMDALRVVLHEEETKEMKLMDKMEVEVRGVE